MDSNTSQGMRLGGISFSCVSSLGMFLLILGSVRFSNRMRGTHDSWVFLLAFVMGSQNNWFMLISNLFHTSSQFAWGRGGGFTGFRTIQRNPSFGFGKTGGSLRGFSWKKIPKLMVFCGAAWPGSFWRGPCMWFGCPYAMGSRSWGDRDWRRVVFRTFWGISGAGGGAWPVIFWGTARGSPRNRDP